MSQPKLWWWKPAATVLFVSAFLVACASLPPAPLQPVTSPSDSREYRQITLANEMEVLLISDPNTPTAAAALDVATGHMDNPPGREGLAHFLEHMLFLGTEKYPDPAAYEEFITAHGGNRNAYTSFDNTNYFFDIDAPYLGDALDRFAQFFIAPQFNADYVEREKNAVEAEYQMGLKSDGRRDLDVMQAVMNPQHPFSRFATGSLETLADRPGDAVRDDLLEFYESHYSANRMRLVVLGAQSLDELQALVEPMFSPVLNRSVQGQGIEAPLFEPGSLPLLVEIKPQASARELQLMFPVADYQDEYRAQPLAYLGNLVGHEGEGSLLSRLKAEGLAESLAASTALQWDGGSLFGVTITLTEKGVEEYEEILQLLFGYMDMLREEGPRERLYREQQQLAELSFRFQEKGSPISYVMRLADAMRQYAPEDLLRGPYMMDDYQPAMLAELMDRIRPENALVILQAPSVETDRVSPWYFTPYSLEALAGEVPASWAGEGAGEGFHLPAPNTFIAEDVSLVALDPNLPTIPSRRFESPRSEIWFAQDGEFRNPKGAMYINFRSPLVGNDPSQAASAVLYTAMLKDRVNEFTYPATLAGLNFSLYKHAQGISLRVSGYNDKQDILLQDITEVILSPDFDPQRFTDIRDDMLRSLRNTAALPPSRQVMGDLREALLYGEWGEEALIEVIEGMTLGDIENYAQAFWRSASAQALLYGNYAPDAIATLQERIAELLPAGEGTPPALPPLRVLELAAGESLLYPVDIAHDDAVLAWYLQARDNTWEERAAMAMTGQLLESGFFQQLRTEQQLGYLVSAFYWPQLDVPGLVMLIQSPVADTAELAKAMDSFLRGVPASLDAELYQRNQRALLNEVLRPEENLWQRAEFYWQSLARKQYDFDSKQQLAAAIEDLDYAQWQAYFERLFLLERHSLQVAAPGKRGVLPPGSQRRVESATALKTGHRTYITD